MTADVLGRGMNLRPWSSVVKALEAEGPGNDSQLFSFLSKLLAYFSEPQFTFLENEDRDLLP